MGKKKVRTSPAKMEEAPKSVEPEGKVEVVNKNEAEKVKAVPVENAKAVPVEKVEEKGEVLSQRQKKRLNAEKRQKELDAKIREEKAKESAQRRIQQIRQKRELAAQQRRDEQNAKSKTNTKAPIALSPENRAQVEAYAQYTQQQGQLGANAAKMFEQYAKDGGAPSLNKEQKEEFMERMKHPGYKDHLMNLMKELLANLEKNVGKDEAQRILKTIEENQEGLDGLDIPEFEGNFEDISNEIQQMLPDKGAASSVVDNCD